MLFLLWCVLQLLKKLLTHKCRPTSQCGATQKRSNCRQRPFSVGWRGVTALSRATSGRTEIGLPSPKTPSVMLHPHSARAEKYFPKGARVKQLKWNSELLQIYFRALRGKSVSCLFSIKSFQNCSNIHIRLDSFTLKRYQQSSVFKEKRSLVSTKNYVNLNLKNSSCPVWGMCGLRGSRWPL